MKTTLKILSLSVFLMLSCNKDDDATGFVPTLPAITQTGANTFGCYAGNILITPRNGTGTFNSEDEGMILWGGYPNNTDYYEIDIHDYKSERTSSILIHVQSAHLNGIGDYIINASNGFNSIDGLDNTYINCRVWRDELGGGYYNYVSFENSGTINITRYDFSEHIISGTFSANLRNFNHPYDIIEITDGRFDIDWDTNTSVIFP
ncbi:hypothetical protein ES692_07525 [Psychroserpens burtonensis]|uniref:Uncharacterized protein n=1 Tax=Psychroserpens burtonensis TaxID=49278 RepID=A0A5C7B9L7_9FLAO|nr:hypothetical protein [Psychroserpens burtonensis]TXE18087.1 hypothetical protein ES692_07525 [Psychroserpens burtonensis]